MTKLSKKFMFVTAVVITIAALLLPAPRMENRMAGVEAVDAPEAQTVAGFVPTGITLDQMQTSRAYTWAG